MNQTSSSAALWLLRAVQITLGAVLVVGIFSLTTHSTESSSKTLEDTLRTAASNDSSVGQAYYQDDCRQSSIAQCRFDDPWSAPATNYAPPESAPEVLRWGSNVDDGLEVTAPLSIKPTVQPTHVASLPVQDDYVSPTISRPTDGVAGWGSLTAEEVKMIERQRAGDAGLEAVEQLNIDFPGDEFDSSAWQDPTGPEVKIEPTVEAFVDFVEANPIELNPIETETENVSEAPLEIVEPPHVDLLLDTETPLSDPVLEESTREEEDVDFGNEFIPMTDLPKDEPELTPEEKERAELQLAPLPKFKKKSSVVGDLDDDSVLKIKDLPSRDGKKKKPTPKFVMRASANPTWWAHQIHQPQLQGRQQLVTTLDEVIFMALRAAPQIQVLNTQPQIQQAALNEAQADFDWSTFVNSTWNDTNDPIGSTLTVGGSGGVNRFLQRDWVFESGLRKRLKSGGDISIGQNFGTVENNSTFLNPPDQGNSRLVLDYRQPLLRGAGPSFNQSQIALANLDLQSISSESLAELQGYLVEVVGAYWNIYLQRAMLVQNRQAVKLAEELFRSLKSRKGIDVLNDQLLRAEAAVAARRSAMIRSEYDLINAQDTLINLVMGAKSETVDQLELLPEPMMLPMGFKVESEQLVQAAIRNRPEVRAAIMQIRSSAIRKQIAANQLLPQLDAIVSSYVSGIRGNSSYTGAFSDQFTTGAPSYTVGFQFEVPLGNRAAKSRLQRSQYEAQIFQREFERQVGDVVLETRIAGREIDRLNRENENNFDALQKAAKELDLIYQRKQLSLDDGKTGSYYIEDLLASQARLTAAEARLAQSQASQAIALIDLKRATGELLRSDVQSYQNVLYEAVPFQEEILFQEEPFQEVSYQGVAMPSETSATLAFPNQEFPAEEFSDFNYPEPQDFGGVATSPIEPTFQQSGAQQVIGQAIEPIGNNVQGGFGYPN